MKNSAREYYKLQKKIAICTYICICFKL